MKMLAKKKSEADRVGQRAWKLLRMALLWARKGGVFKHRLMMELSVVPKFLKNHLGTNASIKSTPQIHYFEREFSFDKTPPLFNLKMHRPPSMRFNIPCLNPPLVLQDDDDDHLFHSEFCDDEGRKSFLTYTDHADEGIDIDDDGDNDLDLGITLTEDYGAAASSCANCEDESVDRKADEFIAKFYQQMKLQRQISSIQFNDMLNRGTD